MWRHWYFVDAFRAAEDCTTYEWLQAFLGTRAIAAALIVVSYLSARGLHILDHIDE